MGTKPRKPKSKPVDAARDSKEGGESREQGRERVPARGDASKNGELDRKPGNEGQDRRKWDDGVRRKTGEDEGRRRKRREEERRLEEERKKREEDRRRRDAERRRREDEERMKQEREEEERRRKEYEDRRRREEERRRERENEERRRREEYEARGRWGHDPVSDPESRRHRSQTRSSSEIDVRLSSVQRAQSETRWSSGYPRRTYAQRLTDVEEDEGFQNFWKWVHNGKKNDFGVSKRLLFYDG